MSIATQLLLLAAVMVLVMSLGWRWQARHANAGIVDVLWAAGLGLAALLTALVGRGATVPRATLAILGTAWAARLAGHLWRRVRGEPEDRRYRQLRLHWHSGTEWKFFVFFQLQTLLVVCFALPFVAVAANPVRGFTLAEVVGCLLWVTSVAGESIADAQLRRFRRDPAHHGRTCRAGLWRYSRHPNYFFEWVHWFAYVALAWSSPLSGLAWVGPVLMYVLLRWVSGIPFTEAQGVRSRGEDYRDYQRTTSLFFPWFPKSSDPARTPR